MNDVESILEKGKEIKNDTDLLEEIRRLVKEDNIPEKSLESSLFIDQPAYKYLKVAFTYSGFNDRGWKWHHVVGNALDPPENREYMYQRLLTLLLEHRGSYDDYFTLQTENEEFKIPNPLADLNKLEILYHKYFKIYQNIKNQIHFEYPKKRHIGAIRGKINWTETIRMSTTDFPMTFVTSVPEKQFVTPENILLILCAVQLHKESQRLLQLDFTDPLSIDKKDILRRIIQNTDLILEGIDFPFVTLLNYSRQYWKLEFNDSKIKDLELKARNRFAHKIIRNQNYIKLLQWMDEFRELNILIQRVSADTKSKSMLESPKDIDTLYEAWIFLEFIHHLHEKHILTNVKFATDNEDKYFKANCTFVWNGIIITFWYEKTFQVGENESYAWALAHSPDFVAMIDDEILAIFDAKNYAKNTSTTDTKNKMLSYMNNLNTNFGALIFPNHPVHWGDLDMGDKKGELAPILKQKYPDDTVMRGSKKREQAKLDWDDEKFEFRLELKKFRPDAYLVNQYPQSEDNKSHPEKTLAILRMQPQNNIFSREMKNTVLDFIFKSIIERIPFIPKVR